MNPTKQRRFKYNDGTIVNSRNQSIGSTVRDANSMNTRTSLAVQGSVSPTMRPNTPLQNLSIGGSTGAGAMMQRPDGSLINNPLGAPSANFQIKPPTTVPSKALAGDITPTDVLTRRKQMEQQQNILNAGTSQLNDISSYLSGDPKLGGVTNVDGVLAKLFSNETLSPARAMQQNILDSQLQNTNDYYQNQKTDAITARKDAGVFNAQSELGNAQKTYADLQKQMRETLRGIDETGTGVARAFRDDQRRAIESKFTAQLADQAIIVTAMQGNLAAAKDIADTIINDQKDAFNAQAAQYTAQLNALMPTLNAEERARAEQMQFAVAERAHLINEQAQMKSDIYNAGIEAAKEGADQATIKSIFNAPTREQALLLASPFLYKPPAGGADVPTVKTINGVDMQWNPATGQWESIPNLGAGTNSMSDPSAKFSMLSTATDKAIELSDAFGTSGIKRKAGDYFVGASRFRQLEAQTNTIKTNLLALQTDPAVRKFFGPQMSEKDTELMMSAASPLDPYKNSPQEGQRLLLEYKSLFDRAKTAVQQGMAQEREASIITAPDGNQYLIVD